MKAFATVFVETNQVPQSIHWSNGDDITVLSDCPYEIPESWKCSMGKRNFESIERAELVIHCEGESESSCGNNVDALWRSLVNLGMARVDRASGLQGSIENGEHTPHQFRCMRSPVSMTMRDYPDITDEFLVMADRCAGGVRLTYERSGHRGRAYMPAVNFGYALDLAMTANTAFERQYQLVRALEALFFLPQFGKRKVFLERCSVLFGRQKTSQTHYSQWYELRNACSHFLLWRDLKPFSGKRTSTQTRLANLRFVETELALMSVYARLFGSEELMSHFESRKKGDAFWSLGEVKVRKLFGGRIDLRGLVYEHSWAARLDQFVGRQH